jgi:hypothetical protein
MTRWTWTLVFAASIAFAGGCSSDYEVAPGYRGGGADAAAARAPAPASESSVRLAEVPETAPASPPSGGSPGLTPAQQAGLEAAARSLVPPGQGGAPSPGVAPAAPGTTASTPPSQAASSPAAATPRPVTPSTPSSPQQLPIRLSAGVALPQSLPTGTAMGFSVDYQFTAGEPGTSPYLWVIEPTRGQPKRQPVQLRERGTLEGFVLEFRPENGPFHTHIEDANGNRLSPSLPLR